MAAVCEFMHWAPATYWALERDELDAVIRLMDFRRQEAQQNKG